MRYLFRFTKSILNAFSLNIFFETLIMTEIYCEMDIFIRYHSISALSVVKRYIFYILRVHSGAISDTEGL